MPEALIINRYKFDSEKRKEFFGTKKTKYDDLDKEVGNTTKEWWTEFSQLDSDKRARAEKIISTNKFDDIELETDPQICSVLKYYKIKR